MWIPVSQMSAERRDVAYPDVRKCFESPAQHGIRARNERRVFELSQRRHRADAQAAVLIHTYAAKISVEAAQADKTCRLKQPRLHHQHQSGAPCDGAHVSVLGIEKRNRFLNSCWFCEVEGFHFCASVGIRSIAAFKFVPNCFATSALFALKTGSPRPPSFPVRLTLDE